MQVRDLMRRRPLSVMPTESLKAAYDLMVECGVHSLPVVDGKALVGMLSERDLARAALDFKAHAMKVADAMTRKVASCSPASTVADVARIFIQSGVDVMPVLGDDSELLGVVSSADLIGLISDKPRSVAASRPSASFKLNDLAGVGDWANRYFMPGVPS